MINKTQETINSTHLHCVCSVISFKSAGFYLE